MKKLTSMAMVLALVLCLATVTFAASGTESDPYTSFDTTLTIPVGETVVFQLAGSDGTVTIVDANNEISVVSPYGQPCGTPNADGSLTVSLAQNCPGGCVLYFSSTAAETKTYTIGGANNGSGTSDDPFTAVGETVDVSSSADVWFQLGSDYYGKNLQILDPNGEIKVFTYRGVLIGSYANGVYTVSDLQQNHMAGMIFYIQSTAAEATTYYTSVTEAPGTESNPYVIDSMPYNGTANVAEGSSGVFYAWNITESGYVTISVSGAAWECQIMDMWDGYPYYSSEMINSVDNSDGTSSVQVDAGDTLLVYINTYEKSYYEGSTTLFDIVHPAGTVDFELSFAKIGSEKAPHDLSYGVYSYVEQNEDGTWYELESKNGHMLQINANGMTVKLDGVAQTPNADGMIIAYVDAGVHTVQVINAGVDVPYFECAVYAKGTVEYPYDAVLGENVQNEDAYTSSGKVYSYTAPVDGTVTLVMDPEGDWLYEIANKTGKVNCGPFSTEDDTVKATYSLDVAAGDVVLLYIQNGAADNFLMEAGSITFELLFKGDEPGTLGNAINVNVPADMTGADVKAGSEMHYNISSQLNGQILTVVGNANTTVTINGVAVKGENGVFSIELTGVPTNSVVIGNTGDKDVSCVVSIEWPLGTEGNPIRVNSFADLASAKIDAESEVWYLFNSQMNGATMTVKGADAYIIVNGSKVSAVDGSVTVNLSAEGATISVVIGNAGKEAAEYAVSYEYPPVGINTVGEYTATVTAGEEVEYVVNSKLDGTIITVKGDGAYIIVNGTKYEAKNGVVSASLTAKGATISVVVGNAGTAAGQYTINVAYDENPKTADAGILMPVAAALVSVMGAAMLVVKKKEN